MLSVLPLQQSHRRIPLIQSTVVLPPPVTPVDVSGAVSPSGTLLLSLQATTALSGAATPAGVIMAGLSLTVSDTGVVVPTGEVTQLRLLQRLLVGFVEPRGPFTLTPLVTKFFRVAAEHYQRYRRLGGN